MSAWLAVRRDVFLIWFIDWLADHLSFEMVDYAEALFRLRATELRRDRG